MQSFSIWHLLIPAAIVAGLAWLVRAARKSKVGAAPGVVGPQGIGGWLVLLAIGVVVSPMRTLALLQEEMEAYAKLEATYSVPNIETAKIVEVVLLLAIVVFQAIVAIMFFQKKRYFPIWYFWQWVATFIVSGAILIFPPLIVGLPWQTGFTPEAIGGLIAILVVGAIWVTYVFRSVRVKNTFVK